MKEHIKNFIYYLSTELQFIYKTKIYPLTVEHHWCKFYDWVHQTEKEGWYVFDKHGKMVPWIHSDDGTFCLYYDMITPIIKERRK